MYSVRRAAEALWVSEALIYALCAAGKIRHERYGLGRGTIRIPADALDDFRKGAAVTPLATSGSVAHQKAVTP
jgi:excisionase family DNA binding protein